MSTLLRYSPLLLLALAWEAVSRLELISSSALPPLSSVIVAWADLLSPTREMPTYDGTFR